MADEASASTASTHGFTLFDELCRGVVKNYSYNLVDLRKKSTRERIDALIKNIHKTITDLECHSDKKIELFCIGKTYAEAKADTKFNPNNVNSWKVKGVSERWNNKNEGYKVQGYDGLVVLGAVSRGMLKKKADKKVWNQQLYVLGLENALITHFAYEECDVRLANESLQPGQLQKSLSAGYVVYMAFKYEEPDESDEESSGTE